MIIDVLKIARSVLVGTASNVVAVLLRSPDADPTDDAAPAENESEEAEWWQHYGFVSKPPRDAEALSVRVGTFFAAIASRALATAGVYGMLKDGDVALYSTGKNVLRLNDDGSVSLLKLTASGKHLVVTVTKADEIKVIVPDGPLLELSAANGIVMNSATAPITIASGVQIQLVAPMLVNECGAVKLHAGASRPMVAGQNAAPNVFV